MSTFDATKVEIYFFNKPGDLEANREGRLGPGQRGRKRTAALIFGGLLAVWVLCMAAAMVAQINAGRGVSGVVSVLVLTALIGSVFVWQLRRARPWLRHGIEVRRLTGQVAIDRGNLVVGGQRVRLPGHVTNPYGGGMRLGPYLDLGLVYTVYVALGVAVGLELAPADGRTGT